MMKAVDGFLVGAVGLVVLYVTIWMLVHWFMLLTLVYAADVG